MDERTTFLINQLRWYEGMAGAIVNSNGYCAYCDEDLLATRSGYSSMVMDHLLPKAKYPEFEWNHANCVLSCSSCNSMKSTWDPLGEPPNDLGDFDIESERERLISEVRKHLRPRLKAREDEWGSVKSLFRSI